MKFLRTLSLSVEKLNSTSHIRTLSNAAPEAKDVKLKSIMDLPCPPKKFLTKNVDMFRDPKNLKNLHLMYQRLHEDYGDMVRIEFPLKKPWVFMFTPQLAAEMYANSGKFVNTQAFEGFRQYRNSVRPDMFPENKGLLGSQEEEWYETRKRVQQDMLRPQSAMFYIDPLQDVSNDLADAIKRSLDENFETKSDTLNMIHLWAFEAISQIFLNTRFHSLDEKKSEESQRMVDSVNVVISLLQNLLVRGIPTWIFMPYILKPNWFKEFDAASSTIHEITRKKIEAIMAEMGDLSQKSYDDMSILEKLVHRNQDIGSSIATVMASDGMMAGVDTTGNTLAFLLYHLAINPEKQERLYQEIVSVVGTDPSQKMAETDLNKLRYLKAALQESQRMLPVVLGTSRMATADCSIGGYFIEKGTGLVQINRVMSNSEKYHKHAGQYIPERWLRENKEEYPCPSFSSIPFGHGTRMCIGRRFATLEIYLATVKILQNFSLEYNHEEELNTETTFVNKPDKPLKIAFKPRQV